MNVMPRFSLIVVDCDVHTARESTLMGMESIFSQTFKDFEMILFHDGFKHLLYPDCLRTVDERLRKDGDGNEVVIFRIVNHKRGTDVMRSGGPPEWVASTACSSSLHGGRGSHSTGAGPTMRRTGICMRSSSRNITRCIWNEISGENFQT